MINDITLEIRFDVEKNVDLVTKRKVYQGRIGSVYHEFDKDTGFREVKWRTLKRKFATKTKAEPYPRRVYLRYTEMLERMTEELEKRMNEEFEKLQLKDGDLVVVKTIEHRQDAVAKTMRQLAGQMTTDVLFLMVTDYENLKKMDDKFMREQGWLRFPPKWWRRFRGWIARRRSEQTT